MGAANARRQMLLNKAKKVGYSSPPRYLCCEGQWYDLRSGNPVRQVPEFAFRKPTMAERIAFEVAKKVIGPNRDLPWEGAVIR